MIDVAALALVSNTRCAVALVVSDVETEPAPAKVLAATPAAVRAIVAAAVASIRPAT